MFTKRLACAVICCAVLLCAGCSSEGDGGDVKKSTERVDSSVKKDTNVKLKDYELPEFLKDSKGADVLSNAAYKSFDPAAIMVEPEKQPFDGYKCTACFNDSVYIFVDGEKYGILDSVGNEVVTSADKITAAAAQLLRVSYSDGSTEYFRVSGDSIVSEKIADFQPERIEFLPVQDTAASEDVKDSSGYLLCLDGQQIYDTVWTSFKKIDGAKLDTQKTYETIYKAEAASGCYYITFDKFYNMTIYEREYGFIRMRLRGEEAACYILSKEHYEDLCTLIGSFGSENRMASVSSGGDNDYIDIALGIAGGEGDEKKDITISPDGLCFTKTGDGSEYFSVMDPETFTDLVSWISGTLSTEYSSH